MTIRKLGKCKDCGEPIPEGYGDDLHDCPNAPKPITGWVAWHPAKGEIPEALYRTKQYCKSELISRLERLGMSVRGWIVRPVELRFTDEEHK